MLILKSRDGSLYAVKAAGRHLSSRQITGTTKSVALGTMVMSMTSVVISDDIVESLEPEGEVGALTRAVLEVRDLHNTNAPYDEFVRCYDRMVALAEAIADRAEVDALEAHP